MVLRRGAVLGDQDEVGFRVEGRYNFQLIDPSCGEDRKMESVFVIDVEGAFPSEPKEKVPTSASASILNPIFSSPAMPDISLFRGST